MKAAQAIHEIRHGMTPGEQGEMGGRVENALRSATVTTVETKTVDLIELLGDPNSDQRPEWTVGSSDEITVKIGSTSYILKGSIARLALKYWHETT